MACCINVNINNLGISMKIIVISKNMYNNRKIRKELQLILKNSLKYFENNLECPHNYAPCKREYITARMSGRYSVLEILRRRRGNNRV